MGPLACFTHNGGSLGCAGHGAAVPASSLLLMGWDGDWGGEQPFSSGPPGAAGGEDELQQGTRRGRAVPGWGLGGSGRQPCALGHPGTPSLSLYMSSCPDPWGSMGFDSQVLRVPEGVKRGEEEQRKKAEGWESAARSGAVCTGLDVSSACLFLLHKHFCQNESQAAEHAAHTHTAAAHHAQLWPRVLPTLLPPAYSMGTPLGNESWGPPEPGLVLTGLSALSKPDGSKPHVPRPPACCAAGAKAWEWACAGVWLLSWAGKKTPPSLGCSLFPMDRPKPCPWGSKGTDPVLGCTQSPSVLLKCPLSCWSPGCVHPSLLSGPILSGDKGLCRAAGAGSSGSCSPFLSSIVLFRIFLFQPSGMHGGGSRGCWSSTNLIQAVSSAIDFASTHGQVVCRDPRVMASCLSAWRELRGSVMAVKSGSHCAIPWDAIPWDGLGNSSATPGPQGTAVLPLSVIPRRAAPDEQALLKLACRAPVGLSA